MQETDPSYTLEQLTLAFAQAGFNGERGLYEHFVRYGQHEEVAPNEFFDPEQYYVNKAVHYYGTDAPTARQIAELKDIFRDHGLNAWSHYVAYGAEEGINPSGTFDAEAYKSLKLDQMRNVDPAATMELLDFALRMAGLTPLEHYLLYGRDEAFVSDQNLLLVNNAASSPAEPVQPDPVQPDPGQSGQVMSFSGKQYGVLKALFNAPGGNDAATVNLENVLSTKGLYVEGVEHLTLHAIGANVLLEDDTPGGVYGNSLQTLRITGDAGSSLKLEEPAAGTIDASGFSGSLHIELTDRFASTVIGSRGNDVIVSDGAADILTGGGGNDVFRFDDELDGHFSSWALHNRVPTITDFSAGDKINVTELGRGISGFAAAASLHVASEADLVAAVRSHLSGGERAVQAVYYNGDTYLAVNGDRYDTDDDLVVRLAGIHDTTSLDVNGGIITAV